MEFVIVGLIVLAVGLFTVARRAWRSAFDATASRPTPPQPGQIANRAAAEAYEQHHPRIRSARCVRRSSLENDEEDNPFSQS